MSGLQEHFLKMTFGHTRSLTHQVLFFLCKLVHSLKNYFKEGVTLLLFPRFFGKYPHILRGSKSTYTPIWEGHFTLPETGFATHWKGWHCSKKCFLLPTKFLFLTCNVNFVWEDIITRCDHGIKRR